jgi:hypothetical protein
MLHEAIANNQAQADGHLAALVETARRCALQPIVLEDVEIEMSTPPAAATIGIPAPTWLAASILIPFAFLGGLAGRPIGDRLGADAFARLAIALLAVAGAYSLGAAALATLAREGRACTRPSAQIAGLPGTVR